MYLWGLKPGSEPPETALAGRLRETLTPEKWKKRLLALKLRNGTVTFQLFGGAGAPPRWQAGTPAPLAG